jgi:hypothetical protein
MKTMIDLPDALFEQTKITEDFNHGQDYGGVTAVNPFL